MLASEDTLKFLKYTQCSHQYLRVLSNAATDGH